MRNLRQLHLFFHNQMIDVRVVIVCRIIYNRDFDPIIITWHIEVN